MTEEGSKGGGAPSPEDGIPGTLLGGQADDNVSAAGMITRTTMKQPESAAPGVEADELTLLVMSAEAFASLPLPRSGTVLLGRSTRCEVQVDDPLASRQHARLHIGPQIEIEDLNSANKTRVRDLPISPGVRVPLAWGEAVGIGSTVLVVERARRAGTPRRIWSHRFFDARLRLECDRPRESGHIFALVRLRLDRPMAWARAVPLMDRDVPPPNVFAAYGPNDYEILLFNMSEEDVAETVERLRTGLQGLDVPSRAGIAWYPRDGRAPDALLAKASSLLHPDREPIQPSRPSAESAVMKAVCDLAARAARSGINVLILGETGSGKEVMAQSIHRISARAEGPFLPINCAGLSEGLLESELFGYERGAFTGAVQSKKGLFEAARGGTLFLDEVGEMPMAVQARVLRAIANREILPLGALKPRSTDVRIVAATNRDLLAETASGSFRRDLYYRLNGLTLTVPPLRERREELDGLVTTLLAEVARDANVPSPELSADAWRTLGDYDWPGNIRELRNVIERAVVLCEGSVIRPEHLSLDRDSALGAVAESVNTGRARRALTIEEERERSRMLEVLRANVWNQSRAARALNMPRRTFVAKLDRYGIPRPQKGSPLAFSRPPSDDADSG